MHKKHSVQTKSDKHTPVTTPYGVLLRTHTHPRWRISNEPLWVVVISAEIEPLIDQWYSQTRGCLSENPAEGGGHQDQDQNQVWLNWTFGGVCEGRTTEYHSAMYYAEHYYVRSSTLLVCTCISWYHDSRRIGLFLDWSGKACIA